MVLLQLLNSALGTLPLQVYSHAHINCDLQKQASGQFWHSVIYQSLIYIDPILLLFY